MNKTASLTSSAPTAQVYRLALCALAKGITAAVLGWANFFLVARHLPGFAFFIFAVLISTALYFYSIWMIIGGAIAGILESISHIRQGNWRGVVWFAVFLLPLAAGFVGVFIAAAGILYKGP